MRGFFGANGAQPNAYHLCRAVPLRIRALTRPASVPRVKPLASVIASVAPRTAGEQSECSALFAAETTLSFPTYPSHSQAAVA
jgi:hypothetical protein